jgi:two-component system chemotaxis response regulator CheB
VVVLDPSISMCHLIAQHLEATDDLDVLGTAWESDEAIELVKRLQPEVIVADVFMRGPRGALAIASIVRERPTRVVIVSSAPEEETRSAVRGLGLRSAEFVPKPVQGIPGEHARMGRALVAAVRRAGQAAREASGESTDDASASSSQEITDPRIARLAPVAGESGTPVERTAPSAPPRPATHLIVLGTSTGGPAALRVVLPRLAAPLNAALIIVQHMPQTFTRSLAKRLDSECAFPVHEAEEDELLVRNVGVMAPGDYHLVVTGESRVHLHRDPPIHGVRPSLDLTLESAAKQYGENMLAVILTGMGVDGARGATIVKALGGAVFAEHASTSVVYGMPRAVVEQGSADRVVPLHEMSEVITSWIQARDRSGLRSAQTMKTPAIG